MIIPETSTKFTVRSEAMYKRIAEKCSHLAELIPGNVAFFSGNLNYQQNKDAVLWFVERVLPLVAEVFADFRLLVLSSSKPYFIKKYPGVMEVVGDETTTFDSLVSKVAVFSTCVSSPNTQDIQPLNPPNNAAQPQQNYAWQSQENKIPPQNAIISNIMWRRIIFISKPIRINSPTTQIVPIINMINLFFNIIY